MRLARRELFITMDDDDDDDYDNNDNNMMMMMMTTAAAAAAAAATAISSAETCALTVLFATAAPVPVAPGPTAFRGQALSGSAPQAGLV